MRMGILGTLFVSVDDNLTAPSAPKLRKVLATLIVHCGQVVPVPALMRELWDENPPMSGLTTLQTYILNLRKLLVTLTGLSAAEVANEILVTRAGGYAFEVDATQLDVHSYNLLVTQGRQALAANDEVRAVQHLNQALRLWRGPALVDVQVGRVLESKARQFEESRLITFEYLVDAQLRLGMYREALAELIVVASDHPLHEGLHSQYMQALQQAGRRAQALEVFRELRQNLVAELGLEPGPDLQRLHYDILNSDGDREHRGRVRAVPAPHEAVHLAGIGSPRTY